MSSLYILCEEAEEEAFGFWLQPVTKLGDSYSFLQFPTLGVAPKSVFNTIELWLNLFAYV